MNRTTPLDDQAMAHPPARRRSPLGRDAVLLLIASCLCIVTRLPALRYDVISDDEAIYDAMARVISDGGVMYRETVDHKPPGLAYTYALARKIVGGPSAPEPLVMGAVHVLGLLATLVTALAAAAIARRLFVGAGVAGWAALAYVLVSTIKQPVDGLAVNGELLLNAATALALVAALAAGTRRGPRRILFDVACGALVCCATLYKYQGLAVAITLPWLWIARAQSWRERIRCIAAAAAASVAGFVLVSSLVVGYFAARGAYDDFLRWALLFNGRYVSDGPGVAQALTRLSMQLIGLVLPALVFYSAGAIGVRRCARTPLAPSACLVPWALVSVVAVSLGGRFFGHYFLQLELPLAIAGAPILAAWSERAPRRVAVVVGLPAVAFFLVAVLPRLSRPYLNAEDPDYAKIGQTIAARTEASDTIWVWGNVPQIYSASGRKAGVRFTFCNYLTGLSPATPSESEPSVDTRGRELPFAWDMVALDLETHPPTLIVDTAVAGLKSYGKYPIDRYAVLAATLARRYRLDTKVDGVALWRRID